jgi:hypothetical protein
MLKWVLKFFPVADLLMAPFVYPAAWLLKLVSMAGVYRLPWCKRILLNCGVFPIRDHYYEPQFDFRKPSSPFAQDRPLPGINWDVDGQLNLLNTFTFSQELVNIPLMKSEPLQFYFNNGTFESGDAEYWYQLIRSVKPERIFEAGSGNSTLMAIKAIQKNREQTPHYHCEHVCIEPYEMPWLEQTGVTVIRKKIEDVEPVFSRRWKRMTSCSSILRISSGHKEMCFIYILSCCRLSTRA